MRWLPVFLFFFSLSAALAQDTTIEGTVYSGSYLKPLRKVKVRMGNRSTKTDLAGHFELPLIEGESLSFYHSQYDTYEMPYKRVLLDKPNDIYLIPTSNLYSMVMEGKKVDRVRSADFENIFDYTFLGDTLVMLSYLNSVDQKHTSPDKTIENCALTFLRLGQMVAREIVPDGVFKLHKDSFDRLFLESPDTCYQVIRNSQKITVAGFSFSEYFMQILPIEGVSTEGVFFIKYYQFLPVRLLKYYDPSKDEAFTIYTARNLNYFAKVEDDFAMLSKADIEAAKKLATQSDIAHQFYGTYIRSFYLDRDISKPKVQGFMVGKKFYFFDFKNNMLLTFDERGELLKSNNTIYLDQLLREKFIQIVQDPYTEKLYSVHEKSGVMYLRKINIDTGSAGRPFKLNNAFAKKIKVFEGYVYYIHESPVTDTNSELLREKLPFR